MQGHAGGYDNAGSVAWSRAVASPLLAVAGRIGQTHEPGFGVTLDPACAIATCLKPADGGPPGSVILRLWEVGGQSAPLVLRLKGCRRVVRTDLLERDQEEIPVARGFAGLRLLP